MEMIIEACGDDHDFPDADVLEPTGTETDPHGRTVNIRRVPCRRCGTLSVTRWYPPPDSADATACVSVAATVRHERPEPGDVPGVAERALQMTDEEYAAALARHGFPEGVPSWFAPDRRTTATPQRLDLTLRVRAGQFVLIDKGRSLGEIIPVPPHAESAGELIDAVPGAALLWAPVHDGDLPLTVLISPADPGPDRSYPRIAELSCRFHTGYVTLHEPAGRALDLPPLPAGHGDYRLRFHTAGTRGLLQIWNRPRTGPRAIV
ncbi:hypothetical protein Acsp04_14350 [Actinomadura sp. NBRC 104425]|uniref:hypothetical protein n=1 Tax=Actinomadura sp. NBRC 104425 TaxID=3032204 RepID=UPI00249F9BBB|nr:hypothetical protein [Actinomadura sp. NBRC 104425]GLZ11200.1 hypothetical protein Acsp04_14350 [Actinomadura sp. NBRC 104425]